MKTFLIYFPYIISLTIGYFLVRNLFLKEEDRPFFIHLILSAGIGLSITPIVNEEGFITTRIRSEVSTIVGWRGPNNEVPWVRTREAEATLRVRDGDTIVLAGLLSSEERKTRSKVPILSDIPILGGLFSSKRTEKVDTEVIITITPRVIEES